ncbi:MAG: penicillin-binding transpeptidase domain-containing protein, partial [Dermatophilaceae bacterium]
ANAYATIAAQGVRAEPYLVKQIRFPDANRAPAIDVVPRTDQVFDRDLMADVITAMQAPVEDGTARYIGRNLDRPAAGKTGTSESFRSAWFDGYVPQLATAVGLYRSGAKGEELQMEDLPSSGDITGSTFPARIWTAYMEAALDGTEEIDFPEPANINRDADPPPPPPEDPDPEPDPPNPPDPTDDPSVVPPSFSPSPGPTRPRPTRTRTKQPTPTPSISLPTPSAAPAGDRQ